MNQHLLRLETDYKQDISSEIIEQFYEKVETRRNDLGAIVILDYGIGELFEDIFIQNLLNKINDAYPDVPILARPNLDNYYLYENIDLIRMNLLKALHTLSIDCCTDTSVSIVGKRILNTSKCNNVLLNYIESESYLFHKDKEKFDKYPSFLNTPIRSYVAVGSVIMAILGLSYAAGIPVKKAVHFALKGASLSAILPPIQFFNQAELLEYIMGD
jgi:bifunctional ADP-heptose synthase (sugar kinase/adenylyltransferase)